MKKLIVIAAALISLASCKVVNTYHVLCVDLGSKPHMTQIVTSNTYQVGQQVSENGHSYIISSVVDFN